MEIKFRKLHPDAVTPTYGTDGAAAFDLYASHEDAAYGRMVVRTSLAFEVPQGYSLDIRSRSGLAFKSGIHAFPGTIDSDYRGEVLVLLMNEDDNEIMKVCQGDRIAQAVIVPIPRVTFKEVIELSTTDRGTAGFGSTGQ